MKTKKLIAPLLFTSLLPITLQAADLDNGKELHDAECLRCHGTEPYTKDGRAVESYSALSRRISMCISMTGAGAEWFPEDQEDVLEHLNAAYYHFKK
ncbi:MAG: cytochrome c [Thiotrichales bacterium]|jgi:hypothetical protein|nr:cytochrome c [Thiotrichales bacterium]MBT3614034.1 cytochrome c [Thiotrichales bacterium]MBT3752397.1 cytochrome c [Thiotrichales bacterium]MBT3836919.1 cytochrome c [Thiotrichales bacterium]MBT4152470.1 cytochrome c [Thiotrichales bacterium]